ncbi:MAG: ComF family protein [Ignavibacteriae bacterium]|nr:ComF family protein [Ignavibacteriota bacterium]
MRSSITSLFDFFLPRLCASCNTKLLLNEKTICNKCIDRLELAKEQRIKNEFARKFEDEKIISDFVSLYVFKTDSEIQNIIHSFKYNQQYQIGIFLGEQIVKHLAKKIISWNADLVIPIPLHNLRKAKRGFNQAGTIAKSIGVNLDIAVRTDIIKRNRFTQTQTKLTLEERKENISEAFSLRKKNIIKNKNIILVDDVITTGATITECSKLLIDSGAKNIYALSVAIAD